MRVIPVEVKKVGIVSGEIKTETVDEKIQQVQEKPQEETKK